MCVTFPPAAASSSREIEYWRIRAPGQAHVNVSGIRHPAAPQLSRLRIFVLQRRPHHHRSELAVFGQLDYGVLRMVALAGAGAGISPLRQPVFAPFLLPPPVPFATPAFALFCLPFAPASFVFSPLSPAPCPAPVPSALAAELPLPLPFCAYPFPAPEPSVLPVKILKPSCSLAAA